MRARLVGVCVLMGVLWPVPSGAADSLLIERGRSASAAISNCVTIDTTPPCDAAVVNVGWTRNNVDGSVTTATFVQVTLYTVTLTGGGGFVAVPVAQGTADRSELRIARDQSSASARGRIRVRACAPSGSPCTGPARTIAYDVDWHAIAPTSVFSFRSRTSFAGCTTVERHRTLDRTASASGTVDGLNLVQAPPVASSISFSKQVVFTTGCLPV